jgi:hypothetical protein
MTYYPQINANGVVTQSPYKSSLSFNNIYQAMPFGRGYSFAQRGSGLNNFPTGPLGSFSVNYTSITDAEVALLSTFFDAMQGSLQPFCFLDPDGNLVNNSEDFSQASWVGQSSGVTVTTNGGLADPLGGSRASQLGGGSYTPVVVPTAGLPTGFVLCASAYVKALAGGMTFTIGFNGLSSAAWPLANGQWTRVYFAQAVNSGGPVSMLLSWSGNIQIFGPSCQPCMGPGNYSKSPDNFGYHPNCRFDTDKFTFVRQGPNQNALALPIAEFFTGTDTNFGGTF